MISQQRRVEYYTCQQREALSYKLAGGKVLFFDGTQTGAKIQEIPVGKALFFEIDNETKDISWFNETVRILKRSIPPSMTDIPLFPFVSMRN